MSRSTSSASHVGTQAQVTVKTSPSSQMPLMLDLDHMASSRSGNVAIGHLSFPVCEQSFPLIMPTILRYVSTAWLEAFQLLQVWFV